MGTLRDSLICGYYDEGKNYIVEIDTKKLINIIGDEYKNFTKDMATKIKLYDALKTEFTKNLDIEYKEFVVEFIGEEDV